MSKTRAIFPGTPEDLNQLREWIDDYRHLVFEEKDYDAAHTAEDEIMTAVLEKIAAGCDNPSEWARTILDAIIAEPIETF